MNKNKIGFLGEQLVSKYLPNSDWVSIKPFKHSNHHDIDWDGLKIEVKTSASPFTSQGGEPIFIFSVSGHNDCDVYVFVGMHKTRNYLWVRSSKDIKASFSGRVGRSINEKDLPEAVYNSR